MKKITLLFLMVSASLFFVTCQKEIPSNPANDLDKKDAFLNSFYNRSYTFGRSINFEAEDRQMHLDEILLSEGNMKGYLVTDKQTKELLYFVNYNEKTGKMDIIDFKKNERVQKSWKKHEIFDPFSNIISSYDNHYRKRKFWGWGCDSGTYDPGPICYHECCYYVAWIRVGDCCRVTCDVNECKKE